VTTNISVNVEAVNGLRVRAVWTWSELAMKAGISPATRSKLRSGRPLSVRTIRAVAKALDVRASEIVQLPKEAGRASEREPNAVGAA